MNSGWIQACLSILHLLQWQLLIATYRFLFDNICKLVQSRQPISLSTGLGLRRATIKAPQWKDWECGWDTEGASWSMFICCFITVLAIGRFARNGSRTATKTLQQQVFEANILQIVTAYSLSFRFRSPICDWIFLPMAGLQKKGRLPGSRKASKRHHLKRIMKCPLCNWLAKGLLEIVCQYESDVLLIVYCNTVYRGEKRKTAPYKRRTITMNKENGVSNILVATT